MSSIDTVLKSNKEYAKGFSNSGFPIAPALRLAVLACMDARMNIEKMLGLKEGDAHIIRNAGGIATVDAIRSLIISHHLLGTREIMIINHTECGMTSVRDEDFMQKLMELYGTPAIAPDCFYGFKRVEENVILQMQKIRNHPWIPDTVSVRGFIYDVKTGELSEVKA
jgi:carbonic anhydrase